MNRTSLLSVVASSFVVVAAGCGGGTKKVAPPVKVATKPVRKPVKKKPPPPVCVAQGEQSVIGMSTADGDLVQFCVADGSGGSQCYGVELDQKKFDKLATPPIPQSPTMASPAARLQSTPQDVTVCTGDGACKTLKPRVKKGENPIEAAINGQGTIVAMLLGDAESGKGEAQVWSVAKKKKLASIKYAKGDYRCGTTHVLDELVFVSAGVCSGPAARGALYSTKGKKIADLGGKDFGTYGTVPVQIGDHRWAFLSETGGVIAIHDSKTGKLEKTIDLLGLWSGGDGDGGDPSGATGGNPGESALLRGADGTLLVVTGSPRAGNIGVVDIDGGTLEVVAAVPCPADEPADDDGEGEGGDEGGGGGGDDEDGGGDEGSGDETDAEPVTDLE